MDIERGQLEDLMGAVPNLAADRDVLVALQDPENPAAQQLAEWLHTEDTWRQSPLRELLPGLAVVDSSLFRYRFDVRTANGLARAGTSPGLRWRI